MQFSCTLIPKITIQEPSSVYTLNLSWSSHISFKVELSTQKKRVTFGAIYKKVVLGDQLILPQHYVPITCTVAIQPLYTREHARPDDHSEP